jgi:basic membrane protein A
MPLLSVLSPSIRRFRLKSNAWYDPPKDTDSAKTLIGQGADVLTQHTNTSAVASAAEAAGKMVIPYNSDMKSVAPNAQIAALVLNWGPYYAKKINQALENKWENKPVWMHLKEGAISLENISDKVPADVVKKMEEVKAKINSGEFHPFTGPIKTNEGKEAVKAGETLPDDKLVTMNYYVDGVVGKVPN